MKLVILIVFTWLTMAASFDAAAQSAPTKIFRCEVQGRVTFADRPCGAQHNEVALGPVNSFKADSNSDRKSSATLDSSITNRTRSTGEVGSIAAEQLRQKQQQQKRCQQLSNQLDALQAKLRSGYTAKQHNSLQQHRHRLEEQFRQSRCR